MLIKSFERRVGARLCRTFGFVACAVAGFTGWTAAAPPDQPGPTSQRKEPPAKAERGLEQLQSEANRLRQQLNDVNRKIAELEFQRRNRPTIASLLRNKSLPESLRIKLADIQREIERLRSAGEKKQVVAMAARLKTVVESLGGSHVRLLQQPELHVVGVYEGMYPNGQRHGGGNHPQGTAEVQINYAGQPIVLALCSYEPVKWRLKLGKGVVIKQVVLSGHHVQAVTGLPGNVPVRNESGRGGKKRFFAYRKDDYSDYYTTIKQLREMTKLEITTFQGTYAYKGKPFVIGPKNSSWKHQLIESRLAPLHRAATRFAKAKLREELQSQRFRAVHRTASSNRMGFGQTHGSWAQFTPTGPIAVTLRPLPSGLSHVAFDARNSMFYAIKSHSVVQFGADDVKKGKTTTLTIDGNLPKLSWPCGLAFDVKRKRVVVTSLGGQGYMYAYTIAEKKWKLLSSMNNIGLAAFTYSPEEDVYYGIAQEHRKGLTTLLTFSPNGAIAKQTRFAKPIPVSRYPFQGGAQLVAVGRKIVVITNPTPNLEIPGEPIVSRSYLVDPRTGKILWSGASRPHAGRRKFAPEELSNLWKAMLGSDVDKADTLMWKLASGGDRTVAFLRKQIQPLPKPNKKRIATLIGQLDADDFKIRDAAYRDLAELGGTAGDQLDQAVREHKSLEVRARARRILKQIASRTGGTPGARRNLHAIDILVRIGNPAAVKFLGELAAESKTATRAQKARDALQRVDRE